MPAATANPTSLVIMPAGFYADKYPRTEGMIRINTGTMYFNSGAKSAVRRKTRLRSR
jgi:hypothetical protein